MKYFNPHYLFKLWVLSAPLLQEKKQSINAMVVNNKNIIDWTNNNTSDLSMLENKKNNFF